MVGFRDVGLLDFVNFCEILILVSVETNNNNKSCVEKIIIMNRHFEEKVCCPQAVKNVMKGKQRTTTTQIVCNCINDHEGFGQRFVALKLQKIQCNE